MLKLGCLGGLRENEKLQAPSLEDLYEVSPLPCVYGDDYQKPDKGPLFGNTCPQRWREGESDGVSFWSVHPQPRS